MKGLPGAHLHACLHLQGRHVPHHDAPVTAARDDLVRVLGEGGLPYQAVMAVHRGTGLAHAVHVDQVGERDAVRAPHHHLGRGSAFRA